MLLFFFFFFFFPLWLRLQTATGYATKTQHRFSASFGNATRHTWARYVAKRRRLPGSGGVCRKLGWKTSHVGKSYIFGDGFWWLVCNSDGGSGRSWNKWRLNRTGWASMSHAFSYRDEIGTSYPWKWGKKWSDHEKWFRSKKWWPFGHIQGPQCLSLARFLNFVSGLWPLMSQVCQGNSRDKTLIITADSMQVLSHYQRSLVFYGIFRCVALKPWIGDQNHGFSSCSHPPPAFLLVELSFFSGL